MKGECDLIKNNFFVFKIYFIYVKAIITHTQRKRETLPSASLSTMSRTGTGQNQEPATPFESPVWIQRPQYLGHFLQLLWD